MYIRCLLFLTLLSLSGCVTRGSESIEGLNRSLPELKKAAERSLPLGLRRESENGRELFSKYFSAEFRKFVPADKRPQRRYAHILILGDRRPYRIEVVVRVEKHAGGLSYRDSGTDQSLAKVIRQRLVQQLSKRREDLNFIDDFRVF